MTLPSPRIRVGDDYYLLASAVAARGRQLVLNHGDSFAIVTESGDCPLSGREPFGVCHAGMRFLDRFELRLNGVAPLLLSADVAPDGSEQISYLTNTDERRGDEVVAQRDTVALERRKVLYDGTLFETLALRNYGVGAFDLQLALLFAADFADIFELRGMQRARRGALHAPQVAGARVVTVYEGLDGVERRLELEFADAPWQLEPESAAFAVRLPPGGEIVAAVTARCLVGGDERRRAVTVRGAAALAAVCDERAATSAQFPQLSSSNALFDQWLACSRRDLALLRAAGPDGDYLYAGIPWFATVFGRDGLLSGLETLAFAPELSAGILRRLAAMQGTREDAERDEAPGKILHECRHGEMAALGEVPFGRYYGSVDATPLFVALLAAYAERTADLELVQALWPAATAAMQWMSASLDARGYLSYLRRTPTGLANQGWKDSHDAISHADGSLAAPPIALCEVQGYVYAAQLGMAQLSERLGDQAAAAEWRAQARGLRERFARDFWLADEGVYALALDGDGQPCRVVASNAGQVLLSGIAAPEHAAQVAARLTRDDCFCGWGIRTLASTARRYNPMSYHNGSVWPHDNALIAAGFARCGDGQRAAQLLSALFDVSREIEDYRLPELFCGFDRALCDRPVSYPVACRPQAWAAASVFLLLQAVLGLSIDAWKQRVTFTRPCLPPWLDALEIRGLRIRDARLDVRIMRGRRSAALEVISKDGAVDVLVRK
jgi:glycogen debranching enzyme